MKKFAAGTAVAAMAGMGLVAAASPSVAACDPRYNKCDDTSTVVDTKTKTNDNGVERVVIKIEVEVKGNDADDKVVKGTYFTSCVGPDGAEKDIEAKAKKNGKPRKINTRFPESGTWTCTTTFVPKNPREVGPSSSSFSFTI